MSEKEPTAPEPIPIERARRRRAGARRGRERWDLEAVAHHLKAETTSLDDELLGLGSRFLIGMAEPPVTALELYQTSSVARIFCQNLVIQLGSIAPPVVPTSEVAADQESVIIQNRGEDNDLRLGITAEGEVSLFIAPHQAVVLPQTSQADEPPNQTELQATELGPAEPIAEPKQERITISGRIGAAPSFRTTSRGSLVARFPVAEHQEQTTIWHQVLVFGHRAEQLRDALVKGESVEVIGYVHERPAKSDASKLIKEIYAALIKTKLSNQEAQLRADRSSSDRPDR